jgi:hypothetical protein
MIPIVTLGLNGNHHHCAHIQFTEEHQAILLLTYREHQPQDRVFTHLTGVSVRVLSYKLPAARQTLAAILDRLDLL